MCGVCGLLGSGPHWSAGSAVLDADRAVTARAERMRVATLLNRLMAPLAVRVSLWSGTSFVVSGPVGAQEIVDSISEVWGAVDRLTRQRVDPLDARWHGDEPASD